MEHCPGLDEQDFNHLGLYDILSREYSLAISQIQHTISAKVADQFEANALEIEVGDPLLVVHTTTFLGNGALFEFATSVYRADQYEYTTTHTFVS